MKHDADQTSVISSRVSFTLFVSRDNQIVAVIGGSGELNIIPAVIQVFLNHFVAGLEPLAAVQQPRIYHRLIPNVVIYENLTAINGEDIELAEEKRLFLTERNHQLEPQAGGGVLQLIVQTLQTQVDMGRKIGKDSDNFAVMHGKLVAVSDTRKDGKPVAV